MQRFAKPIRKRRHSVNLSGHAHELTFSCHHRWPLLSKDRSRNWLIDALDHTRERYRLTYWAYVIMPEHVHLLLMPPSGKYDIAAILRSIKQPVARAAVRFLKQADPVWLTRLRVTRKGERVEHRFWQQGGGYDRNVIEPATAWKVIDYIHGNPVRRRLCDRAIDWPWSSARWYAGMQDVPLQMDGRPPDSV